MRCDRVATPLGEMWLVADDSGQLCGLDWISDDHRLERLIEHHYGMTLEACAQQADPHGLSSRLRAYFAGDLRVFDEVPVATTGTAFQRRVWAGLREIPLGTCTTYGELATRLGQPSAVRAVGHANGSNPVSIAVPCHRVIGANGSLTGYAGGLERKRWLLQHEGALPATQPALF